MTKQSLTNLQSDQIEEELKRHAPSSSMGMTKLIQIIIIIA